MDEKQITKLLNAHDYSFFLGGQCLRKEDDLKKEKADYEEIKNEIKIDFEKYKKILSFIEGQLRAIDYGLKHHKEIKLEKIQLP